MKGMIHKHIITLDIEESIWEHFFTVFPLVLIGTREPDGDYDLATKHLAMPMSWENYFGFVCTPRHGTYHNIKREGVFTVSYLQSPQVLAASIAATPRWEDNTKPSLAALKTFRASRVDGVFAEEGYLFLECELERMVDDLGVNSLILGRIVAAHVHEDAFRGKDRDDNDIIRQMPILAYLYPGRFTEIRASHAFPFPVDFKR